MTLALMNLVPYGISNTDLINTFCTALSDPCSKIYAGLRVFTVVLAFAGLLQAAYKVQMGGDLTGLGMQLVMTLLVSMSLLFAPAWILNSEITLGPYLLDGLGIDVATSFNNFISQLGQDTVDAVGGMIAEIMLGFFFLGLQFMGLISLLIIVIAWCILAVTYGAVIVGYMLQVAVIYLALTLLPIFLGMLLFERTRETGYKYIIGIVGILFWQLGWGMGFMIVTQIFGSVQTAMNNNGALTAVNVVFGGIISSCCGILESLCMWAVLTKAPKIVSDAIVSGSQVGTGLVSAGASTISSAVSTSVSAAGSVAMIAATGGAGAPAAGAAMGAKGGAAMGAATG